MAALRATIVLLEKQLDGARREIDRADRRHVRVSASVVTLIGFLAVTTWLLLDRGILVLASPF